MSTINERLQKHLKLSLFIAVITQGRCYPSRQGISWEWASSWDYLPVQDAAIEAIRLLRQKRSLICWSAQAPSWTVSKRFTQQKDTWAQRLWNHRASIRGTQSEHAKRSVSISFECRQSSTVEAAPEMGLTTLKFSPAPEPLVAST